MVAILTAALPVVLSGVLGLVTWLVQTTWKSRRQCDKIHMLLMRGELRDMYIEIKARGTVTPDELGLWNDIYVMYKELKGNGVVDVWKKEIEGMCK